MRTLKSTLIVLAAATLLLFASCAPKSPVSDLPSGLVSESPSEVSSEVSSVDEPESSEEEISSQESEVSDPVSSQTYELVSVNEPSVPVSSEENVSSVPDTSSYVQPQSSLNSVLRTVGKRSVEGKAITCYCEDGDHYTIHVITNTNDGAIRASYEYYPKQTDYNEAASTLESENRKDDIQVICLGEYEEPAVPSFADCYYISMFGFTLWK